MYPTPDQIKEARTKAGLTQDRAADVLGVTPRAWKYWEAGDRKMRPIFFELFVSRAPKFKAKKGA